MADHAIEQFASGVNNVLGNENIPVDAAQDEKNWLTEDGELSLVRGKNLLGDEGLAGDVRGLWFGYKVNGSKVTWRKSGTAIQYLNTITNLWVDVVTGLGADDIYSFQNYSSLAGSFTFATGTGGIFKFNNANPTSYIDLYDSTKNFKGFSLIDKGRMLMYGLTKDQTGLYGSYIDAQNSTVYTSIANENLASGNGTQLTFSGILAFKGSNPKANAFAVVIKCTDASGEQFVDNFDGTLTGSAGGTGTINYITGAYSVTFVTVPANAANNVKADYQWENSNAKGVTDFTKSATRLAGEGFVLRQDEGGDKIMKVLMGLDGSYYSIKRFSVYQYTPDSTDTKPDNIVYRKDIGIPTPNAAVATGRGIVFLNTANTEKPLMTVLEKDPIGSGVVPTVLLTQFKFENYNFDDLYMESWGQYILVSCKTTDALSNDRLLLCDTSNNKVDITHYGMKCLAKADGALYGGSALTRSVYKLFDGFDDDGVAIENYWLGKAEKYSQSERLKKVRRLRVRGKISQEQILEMYISFDDQTPTLIGTVRGDSAYVDMSAPGTIGNTMVGEKSVGGGTGTVETVYPYFAELKVKCPKFRKRAIYMVARGIGAVSVCATLDWDIMLFDNRLPKQYRLKQNVSVDGTTTDMPNPSV